MSEGKGIIFYSKKIRWKMISDKYLYKNKYTEEFLNFASKDYAHKDKMITRCVDNGVVLPLKKSKPGGPLMGYGGVLDAENNYINESAQIGKGDTLDRFVGKYEYDQASEIYLDETVVYIGAFPSHWGHFLVDMVYRLWYFLEHDEPYRIVYCSENVEISGVYLEFFKLLGIDKDRLFRIAIPTRFGRIIIPQAAYMACDYYTQEYRNVFRKVVKSISRTDIEPYEKIYLSRGHFVDAHSKEVGEQNIEYNFRMNGFHVLYMEELSLEEQIFYIHNSKAVAALSGTLCHNIVFAGENTELIILNKTHITNTHQVLINQMMGVPVTYIDVYKEPYRQFPISYGGGPFWLDTGGLREYFCDKLFDFFPERKYTTFLNGLRYTKMCFEIKLYKLYEKMYYILCEHKYIISFLRRVKKFVGR